ncbi:hypothetical protein Q3G72_013338 [Acer saccharum]|nr:hypothetical protein Q3G72_013338 [Acer saccharum]
MLELARDIAFISKERWEIVPTLALPLSDALSHHFPSLLKSFFASILPTRTQVALPSLRSFPTRRVTSTNVTRAAFKAMSSQSEDSLNPSLARMIDNYQGDPSEVDLILSDLGSDSGHHDGVAVVRPPTDSSVGEVRS